VAWGMRKGRSRPAILPASARELTMMSCDYNGWNDAPEDEREWFDEHPEIWQASLRDTDVRPLRATRRPPVRRFRGGLAA
jgi:hypothetical protein